MWTLTCNGHAIPKSRCTRVPWAGLSEQNALPLPERWVTVNTNGILPYLSRIIPTPKPTWQERGTREATGVQGLCALFPGLPSWLLCSLPASAPKAGSHRRVGRELVLQSSWEWPEFWDLNTRPETSSKRHTPDPHLGHHRWIACPASRWMLFPQEDALQPCYLKCYLHYPDEFQDCTASRGSFLNLMSLHVQFPNSALFHNISSPYLTNGWQLSQKHLEHWRRERLL